VASVNTPAEPMPAVPPPPASAPSDDIVVQVFGRTDVGRTRDHNEDAFLVADLSADVAAVPTEVRRTISGQKGSLFMVADGMGGAAAGEIASAMAIEAVLREVSAALTAGKGLPWVDDKYPWPEHFPKPQAKPRGRAARLAGLLGPSYMSAAT